MVRIYFQAKDVHYCTYNKVVGKCRLAKSWIDRTNHRNATWLHKISANKEPSQPWIIRQEPGYPTSILKDNNQRENVLGTTAQSGELAYLQMNIGIVLVL